MAENGERRVMLLLDEADQFFEQDSHNDFVRNASSGSVDGSDGPCFKVVLLKAHTTCCG